MALIKCPECGKEISDTVDVCPNCGFSMKKKKYNKKIIIGAAIVVIGAGGFLFANRVTPTEQAQINNVYNVISEIGTVDTGSRAKIEKAEKQYEALSSKCKRHVKNRNELNSARKSYDKLLAGNLDEDISEIGEVMLDKKNEIDRLNMVYDGLTEDQQKLVKNKKVLDEDTASVLTLKIADVQTKISDIGTVSLDSGEKITAARNAFESLSEEEQAKVENAGDLQKAEDSYSTLAVKECENLINAIGEVTLDSKDVIYQAQNFYNSLSESDKQKVSNSYSLTADNNEYMRLVSEEQERQRTMNIGDTVTSKDWELQLKRVNITAKILPNSTSGYYTYYYADDNETFIDLVFQMKNVNVEILGIDGAVGSCTVDYGGNKVSKQYNLYTSRGSRIEAVYDWDGLDALDTTTLHVAIRMPRECQTNNEPITVRLILAGQEKIIKVR